MRKDRLRLTAFFLLTATLAVIGYWRIFTQFMIYDDEGSFLWSLNSYCAEGGLYDRVTSLYGPFYFTFNHLLHALTGLNFNHDTGRLLTLCYWCGAALLCGWVTWRQTCSVLAALAAQALTFVCLITMIREPMHPSGFLTFAVALAVVAAHVTSIGKRPAAFAVAVALLGMAMALSKINVGVFFLIAAGSWLVINSRTAANTRVVTLLIALACAVLPMLLMWAQWPRPWVVVYVLVFTCGALTLTAALHDARQPEHGLRSWGSGFAIAGAFALIVLVAASAQGNSWAGLWDSVVTAPRGFSQTIYLPRSWPAGVRELAIIQALVTVAYYLRRGAARMALVIAVLRLAVGAWFFIRIPGLFAEATSLQNFCFYYGPSLAWLMAVPLSATASTGLGRARLWLAWVFIWQTLQAYPVAGSQIGWGSFLWVPLFIAGWHEAVVFLANHFRFWPRLVQAVTGVVLTSVATVALWPIASVGYQRFTLNEPLGLPGAERLRLASDVTSDLRILHQNIRAHGGVLFSYPDMFSFNVWTGHRHPALTRGMAEARERALLDQLEMDPRAIVVVSPLRIEVFKALGLVQLVQPETLTRFLVEHFAPAVRLGDYELWIHRGRQIAAFSTARWLPADAANRQRLELTVAALARPVATVEVALLNAPHTVVQRLALDAAQPWQLTLINESGLPLAAATQGSGSVMISQPARFTLEFLPANPLPALNQMEIRLLDAAGQVLGRLRFAG